MVRKATSHELKPKRVGLPVPKRTNKCTEEEVRKALYACHGRIGLTAQLLDIHPGTLRKYIVKDYPQLKRVLKDCKTVLGDMVEEKLYDKALKGQGNVRAMIHILARQFPERGWALTKHVNVKHEDVTPKQQGIVISDEKKAEILAAVLAKFPTTGQGPPPVEGLKELPPSDNRVSERIILEHQPDGESDNALPGE